MKSHLKINHFKTNNNCTVLYKKMKAVYCFTDFFVGYRKGNLYRCSLSKNEISWICKVPLKKFQQIGSKIRIIERALHINPRGAVSLSENNILLPMKGVIYRIDINTGEIAADHIFRHGMNAPIELFKVVGVNGIDDCIIYGEYINDLNPHEISIYSRTLNVNGKWEKRFTFSKGMIQHIHTFAYGIGRNSLLMMTGDQPEESGIWRITDNFRNVEKVCAGSVEYRACIAVETNRGILYATDNPFALNHLYLLKSRGQKEKLYDLEGTVINGRLCNKELYINTTVECNPFTSNWQVFFPLKRSRANPDNIVRIKKYTEQDGLKEIAAFRKDLWYMPLFQFGTVEFCPGESDVVLCTPMAVHKYDNTVLQIE